MAEQKSNLVPGLANKMSPKFFLSPLEWRSWLEKYHAQRDELLVGFHKKGSGKPGITWPESVDVALCFGWIDGVRRRIDDVSYSIRFTPRKPRSTWSAVNIRRVGELTAQGSMHPSGLQAFAARQDARSAIYSFEQDHVAFSPQQEAVFRAHGSAWGFFAAQAPWYRKAATWWVISAKRKETREKRLTTLINDSEHRRALAHLTRQAPPR